MKEVILASSSESRRQQLSRLHIEFKCMSPDVDEEPYKSKGLDPKQLSAELSLLKARSVSAKDQDAIVIGGDQVAYFDGQILSKPKSKEKAIEQLTLVAGKEHQLLTSLAIISDGQELLYTNVANLKMRRLSDEQIERYIDIDMPLQSCGSYRLEALGISLFESIDCDDFSAITGVPLMWTAKILSSLGVSVP